MRTEPPPAASGAAPPSASAAGRFSGTALVASVERDVATLLVQIESIEHTDLRRRGDASALLRQRDRLLRLVHAGLRVYRDDFGKAAAVSLWHEVSQGKR